MNEAMEIKGEITYYPVIIPTLNRYEHFKRCVESLQSNTHAEKTELVIGIDYPPNDKYVYGWRKICDYSKNIIGFKKVTIFFREENLGPRENCNRLKEYVLANYDAYIVTEDDNVFSPNFLDFIDQGLNIYKKDKTILAICGYMSPITFNQIDYSNTTVVKIQEYETWGYGRWGDRDEELAFFMPDNYMEFICRHRKYLRKLHKYPRNLYQLLFWPLFNPRLNGKVDFALSCYCKLNGKYTINPISSLVRNEGNDGTGVNNARIIDIRSTQIISKDDSFLYMNNLSEEEENLIMKIVGDWKDKDYMELPLNKPWRLITEIFYLSIMMFGYKASISLFNLCKKIKRFIKNEL